MSGGHAKRLTITLGAAWRPYTPALPGWEMLGTVTRGEGDVGALARSPRGIYCQVNAGVCRSLDQRKVLAALESTATIEEASEHAR
jgi:hypothetical protein